jgi:hypothetical protein
MAGWIRAITSFPAEKIRKRIEKKKPKQTLWLFNIRGLNADYTD